MLALHRCKTCGTRWLLWPDAIHGGGWNLLDQYQRPGSCCDNVAMGDQIEHLRDLPLTSWRHDPAPMTSAQAALGSLPVPDTEELQKLIAALPHYMLSNPLNRGLDEAFVSWDELSALLSRSAQEPPTMKRETGTPRRNSKT